MYNILVRVVKLIPKISILAITIYSGFVFGQTIPIDTAYYDNGMIKSITFRKDWRYTGEPCRVIYSKYPVNDSEIGRRLSESVLQFDYDQTGVTRYYYLSKLVLIKMTDYFIDTPLVVYRIHILFKEVNPLLFVRQFYNDSSIRLLGFYIVDSTNLTNARTLLHLPLSEQTEIGQLNEFDYSEEGKFYLEIKNKGYLDNLNYIFKNKEGQIISMSIEFFSNQDIKSIAYLNTETNRGKEYIFYKGGPIIESEGGFIFNGEFELSKDSEWRYYNNEGKLTRIETWENSRNITR